MSTLGSTPRQRLAGRLVFYGLVLSGLWTANRVLPDPASAETEKWESLGVARAYIAVPWEVVVREGVVRAR